MKTRGSSSYAEYLSNFERKAIPSIVPVRSRPYVHKDAPQIVNMVSTVLILPQNQGYKLPLESISRALGHCSQFTPAQFAANIVKTTDSISGCTALIFRSGNMVVVSAETQNHVRDTCQRFRLIVEQVQCPMEGGVVSTLQGRTIFKQCSICNIVGHSYLGMNIDLEALRDAGPDACKYTPDNFPGLKCHIWLTESQECVCKNKIKIEDEEVRVLLKKQTKCSCTVKCLVFKTGRIVIIGARRISDINSVFFRIKRIAPNFEQGAIPKNNKFYNAFAQMMIKKKPEKAPEEAVSSVLNQVRNLEPVVKNGKKRARLYPANAPVQEKAFAMSSLCPLIKFADAGRVDEVTFTLAMDPKQAYATDSEGRTALERLKGIPSDRRTPQHDAIIKKLELYKCFS